MPPSLRADPTWTYWYGRALKAEGRPAEAQDHFARIALQFHFYGKLAAEELGIPIVLPMQAPAPTAGDIAPMAGKPGFARAQKFYELGLRVEGNREWNWQLRGMVIKSRGPTTPINPSSAESARCRSENPGQRGQQQRQHHGARERQHDLLAVAPEAQISR